MGFVVGGVVVGLLIIVIGPSRRVRSETGMDDEVETRLLLGLDPEPDRDPPTPILTATSAADYDPAQIKALEDLAKHPKQRKGNPA